MVCEEDTIKAVIDIEWGMFQNTENIAGRASCQEDPETFKIMRSSQFENWSKEAVESYLDDLNEATRKGENLIAEKYARMMKSTSPIEYSKVEHLLHPVQDEVIGLIDNIVKIVLDWEEELSLEVPYILKKGRPLHASTDSFGVTSLETYLRGELSTYSKKTLELLYAHFLKEKSQNINGSKITMEFMVKKYGYQSLAEANEAMKKRSIHAR
jgi:hypothetical protein